MKIKAILFVAAWMLSSTIQSWGAEEVFENKAKAQKGTYDLLLAVLRSALVKEQSVMRSGEQHRFLRAVECGCIYSLDSSRVLSCFLQDESNRGLHLSVSKKYESAFAIFLKRAGVPPMPNRWRGATSSHRVAGMISCDSQKCSLRFSESGIGI